MGRATLFQPQLTHSGILLLPLTPLLLQPPGGGGLPPLITAGWLTGSAVKNLPAMQEMQVRSLGWEDPLEEEMATCFSIPVRTVPWTEEPGGLVHGVTKSDTMEQLTAARLGPLVFPVPWKPTPWIKPCPSLLLDPTGNNWRG